MNYRPQPFDRREFLKAGAALGTGLAFPRLSRGASGDKKLKAGEAIVDSTPPLGIELAGFHRRPDPFLHTGRSHLQKTGLHPSPGNHLGQPFRHFDHFPVGFFLATSVRAQEHRPLPPPSAGPTHTGTSRISRSAGYSKTRPSPGR